MIRVFESFAGIGTQRMGLERAGIDHEVVGICEIDKFAINSYQAIHGETKNYGDISKIDPKDFQILICLLFRGLARTSPWPVNKKDLKRVAEHKVAYFGNVKG